MSDVVIEVLRKGRAVADQLGPGAHIEIKPLGDGKHAITVHDRGRHWDVGVEVVAVKIGYAKEGR